MVRRLRVMVDRADRAGRAVWVVGLVGLLAVTRTVQYWKILSIHPPSSIMHRFRRFLNRWITQNKFHNLRTFSVEICVGKWIIKIVKYKYEIIFLMFVLTSALDRRWYSGLINKINYDLIINYIYKSDFFLA